jgi:hypothetical protein
MTTIRQWCCSAAFMIACAGLVACSSATQQPTRITRVDNVEQIVASIPDSAMRTRWRQAAANGQLPDLRTLPVPAAPVATRKRVVIHGNEPLPRGLLIPDQAVADVRLVGADTLREYRGPITLRDSTAGRLTGFLSSRAPVEIQYKLPANQRLMLMPGTLLLTYRDDVVNHSLRRELLLTASEVPVLMHLNDGSSTPYDRTFREFALRVRQTGQVEQHVSPVEITYRDQQLVLRLGERKRARDANGEVEFFLLSSHYLQAGEILTAEGDPYHVTLMMYRPR